MNDAYPKDDGPPALQISQNQLHDVGNLKKSKQSRNMMRCEELFVWFLTAVEQQ